MTDRATASVTEEIVAGSIERVTFHNEDNGFCVLRVRVRGHRDAVTIVGHSATVAAGEWITANGSWTNDRNYGQQFKARFLRVSPPTSLDGIAKYLGSGMIRGIGPVYAKKLVNAFKEQVFEVIEQTPDQLQSVPGIGPKRAARMVAAWAEQKIVREIMIFLHSHGVGTARAVRIFKTYGNDAIQVMSQNPYCLARDIRGIGFITADAIAAKLGIEKTAMVRLRAGITYALTEAMSDGHCGLPRDELLDIASELLKIEDTDLGPQLAQALALELGDGTVIADTTQDRDCIFLAGLYHAEKSIAALLGDLQQEPCPWPEIDADKAMPWVAGKIGLTLAPQQQAAIRAALREKVLIITGGPGVGKTTIVNGILRILGAKDIKIRLAAPTGRAAKRLAETTGLEAKTIHRLLEADPRAGGFKRNEDNPLDCDLLVLDETSMIDVPLMANLLRALPKESALLCVGDIDQLPSVGPGRVLADMIAAETIEVVRLTEVFRQAQESRIIATAHRINEGNMPDLQNTETLSDFYFVAADTPEQGVERIVELVSQRIPRRFGLDPVRDIQVLCPMNRGGVGARSLNLTLQETLNPTKDQSVTRFGWTFSAGDKIMQMENDYDRDVFNGDIGYIVSVDSETQTVVADFDGRTVEFGFGDLDSLVPAYATTIHKSQGSEYPAVVIPVMTQHYAMLQRNLIYTGITRGKNLVVLVGQKKAIAIAVKNRGSRRRWTKLKSWLQESKMVSNRQNETVRLREK